LNDVEVKLEYQVSVSNMCAVLGI